MVLIEEVVDMDMNERMTIIENMAKAGLPMVGFSNFVIERENEVDSDALGEEYLRILKEHNCCGVGNRPHYLKVEVPGGNVEMVIRRFFDSLSGSQFYANRLYGVINFSLSAFSDFVDVSILDSMKEYLLVNRENLRFILSDVPKESVKDIIKWESVDIFVVKDKKPDVHEFVDEYLLKKEVSFSREIQKLLEMLVSKFPTEAWERTLDFAISQDDEFVKAIIDEQCEGMIQQPGRIGFSA